MKEETKQRIKYFFKSPITKSLEKAEEEASISAKEANALIAKYGIVCLSKPQMLFVPNRYYSKELGIFTASYEEIIELCKFISLNLAE